MVHLVSLTESEFQAYWQRAIPGYAEEHVKAGNWNASEALQRAEKEFRQLLPDGLATKNQYLYSIVDGETGSKVGMVWFSVDDNRSEPSAFVNDFMIHEEFRRQGYGTQALRAVEETVKELGVSKISLHVFGHNHAARALYDRVGYETSDILMTKRIL